MPSLIKQIKNAYKLSLPHDREAVLKNFTSLTTLQAITYILPIIVLPYLFRAIGADKFGLIAFAQSFVQYFMVLTDYGFNVSATKEISLCKGDHGKTCKIFSEVMTVKLGLALLSLIALGIIVYSIPKFRHDWLVYALSFGAVLGGTLFPVWFFQGTEKMRHIADLNILGGLAYAALIFIFVRLPKDYLLVPLFYSGTSLVTGLLAFNIAFNKFGVSFKLLGYRNVRHQLRAGWDVFISIAAINAYTTTRVFTVGLLTNNTVTGVYFMAEKIANVFQTFPQASLAQALFPRLSKIYHKNKNKALEIMTRLQGISNTLSIITLPLGFILAPLIVRLACAATYPEAIISLRLLLIAVFFVRANTFRVQFLLVCGKTDIYSRIHVSAAMVGLLLIFLLVDSFSYRGAAIATIIIESGIFTVTYFLVKGLKFKPSSSLT